MKFSSSKYFILFLIIGIIFYAASFQTAEAGWFKNAMSSVSNTWNSAVNNVAVAVVQIVASVAIVVNNIINTVIAVGEIAVGTVFKSIGIDNSILQSGKCRLSNRSDDSSQYFLINVIQRQELFIRQALLCPRQILGVFL